MPDRYMKGPAGVNHDELPTLSTIDGSGVADGNGRRLRGAELEAVFAVSLESFLRNWGPITWKDQVAEIAPTHEPRLATLLHALSGIEDDAFYMQKKLRHSGAARQQAIKHFNSVWLVEEAEHARALGALSARFGGPGSVDRAQHSTFKRDPRSILAIPSLKVASVYTRGITAAYMTLGMLVEFVAVSTYNAIPRLYPCGPMGDVLSQMSRQEGRHLKFYRAGAIALLEGDKVAQAFVRRVVDRYWRPPGVDLYGLGDWQRMFSPILEDPTARDTYLRVDDLLTKLPGMQGLSPMHDFLEQNRRTAVPARVTR